MAYPFVFALRYLGSKKRASISVGTVFAILGVALGVAALATIMSVTGGFHQQFREKVLGVNAHVLVLKYSTNFGEYRDVMELVAKVDGVVGVAPFSINPMMLTHGDATATGVLVKGVDPELSLGVPPSAESEWKGKFSQLEAVLDLPKYVIAGKLDGLRKPGAKPAPNKPTTTTSIVGRPSSVTVIEGTGAGQERASPRPAGGAAASAPSGDAADIRSPAAAPEATLAVPPPEPPDAPAGANRAASGSPTAAAGSSSVRMQPPASAASTGPAGTSPERPTPPANPTAVETGPASTPAAARPAKPSDGPSALPEEDILPDELEADPCSDPAQVAKMPGIVMGVSLAKSLGLRNTTKPDGTVEWQLGDCVTVTSPTIGFTFASGQIKPPVAKRFRVIAIFEAGFDQYDSKLVYTDLWEAQTFYDHGDTVTGVEMKVSNIDEARHISNIIALKLASGMYHTMDWEELNHGLFTALRIQQIGMSAVLALIIVVAAFTVVATLIMVVLDKTREISVLKAMGARDDAVLRIFLYQGGMIGLGGTLLGLLLGIAVCKGLLVYGFPLDPKVYFISRLPVQIRFEEFALTGAIAVFICLVATIIPSLYAARLRPADGFRQA